MMFKSSNNGNKSQQRPSHKSAMFENFFKPQPAPMKSSQQQIQKPIIKNENSQSIQQKQSNQENGIGLIEKMSDHKADQLATDRPDIKKVTYGMRNLGNTCFFNSVMQCLSHSRALVNFCMSNAHSQQCKKKESCYLCTYTSYLKSIQREQRTNPQMIVYKLKAIWSRYSVGRQEDAHEFLIIFLESLVNSCFQMARPPRDFLYKNQNKTSIFQLIGGKSRSQIHCLGCGHKSNTYEDLIALSLEFPKMRQMGGPTLEQCLLNFCTVETLKGDNKYMCSACKKKCEARKRFSVEQSPRTLIIHLKRFTNFGSKLGEFVKYPTTLSLKPYMSSTLDNDKASTSLSEMYDLYGVVVHAGGGCRSGHYYSYCKGFDGEWYDCNDDFVGRTQQDRVLKQQAYLLFYQKRITPVKVVEEVVKKSVTIEQKVTTEINQKKEEKKIVITETNILKTHEFMQSTISSISEQTTALSSNNLNEDIMNKEKSDKPIELSKSQIQKDIQISISASADPKFADNQHISSQPIELKTDPNLRRAVSVSQQDETTPSPISSAHQIQDQANQNDQIPEELQKIKTTILEEAAKVQNPPINKSKAEIIPKTHKKEENSQNRTIPQFFAPLRSQLHPKVMSLNTKKRKYEATLSLIKMVNRDSQDGLIEEKEQKAILSYTSANARSTQLFKRFKSNLNPEYQAQQQMSSLNKQK